MRYRYVDLGMLNPNAAPGLDRRSNGSALNEAGEVVGDSFSKTTRLHAFRWRDGTKRDLGAATATGSSYATGINEWGMVVGASHVDTDNPPHAVIWRKGVLTDLGTGYGKGSQSSAAALNDRGQVVGLHATSATAPKRAVLWADGRIRDLGTLGGTTDGGQNDTESEANAINNAGQVVGVARAPGARPLHGFLWQDGRMRDLGNLGGTTESTQPYDINDNGTVVGTSQAGDGYSYAFLWRNGTMRSLGTVGPRFYFSGSTAAAVNNSNVVVGSFRLKGDCVYQACFRAFVSQDGVMRNLNALTDGVPANRRLTLAKDINDKGVIVARSCEVADCDRQTAGEGTSRAVLLVPIT